MAEFGCFASIPLPPDTSRPSATTAGKLSCQSKQAGAAPARRARAQGRAVRRARTSSPARCPWRATRQRTASSTRCPGGSSCSPCPPTGSCACGCAACARLQARGSSCARASALSPRSGRAQADRHARPHRQRSTCASGAARPHTAACGAVQAARTQGQGGRAPHGDSLR